MLRFQSEFLLCVSFAQILERIALGPNWLRDEYELGKKVAAALQAAYWGVQDWALMLVFDWVNVSVVKNFDGLLNIFPFKTFRISADLQLYYSGIGSCQVKKSLDAAYVPQGSLERLRYTTRNLILLNGINCICLAILLAIPVHKASNQRLGKTWNDFLLCHWQIIVNDIVLMKLMNLNVGMRFNHRTADYWQEKFWISLKVFPG